MNAERRSALTAILVAAVSAAVLITAFGFGFFPVQGDELTLAWAGKQTAMGRVPYHDFFAFLPPLTLYGTAALFKLAAPTLAALRAFTVLWLIGIALLLFGLQRRAGMSDGWAAAAAMLFPALIVPFWPVPSHHWFAVGLGLAALWVSAGAEANAPRRWLCAGFLCGCSGLCLQSEGALFCVLLATLWLLLPANPSGGKLWVGLALAAGVLLPVALFATLLAWNGSLGQAAYDLAVWPSRYYRQAGGFNDVSLFQSLSMIGQEFWARLSAGPSLDTVLKFATFLCSLALVMAVPLLLLWALWSRRGRAWTTRRMWIWSALGTAATFLVYLQGRADWVHLSFFFPLFLVFAASAVEWDSPGRACKAWTVLVLVCLGVSAARWAAVWVHHPPLLDRILRADAFFVKDGPPSLVESLKNGDGTMPPVLYLPQGGLLYFNWAPDPPPITLLLPPSYHVNAPAEYASLSAFAESHRIPYILIEKRYEGAFVSEPSPLSDLLRRRYVPFKEEASVVFFRRVADAPAGN